MSTRPPRLLAKTTVAVTLVTMAMLLMVVAVVTLSVRGRVRDGVLANLESSQRMFGALEARRQRELRAQAETLAESPTLKASLDTYIAELPTSDVNTQIQLLNTIAVELDKLGSRFDADAVVLTDTRRATLAVAGRAEDRFQRGRTLNITADANASDASDGVIHATGSSFRVVSVPLVLAGDMIGMLHIATALDRDYARTLADLSRSGIVVAAEGRVLASSLADHTVSELEDGMTRLGAEGTVEAAGESYAYRRLVQFGDTQLYAVESIDDSAAAPMRDAMRSLALVAAGAMVLALAGSFWLARLLTTPIGQLSASLARMAADRDTSARLPLTGFSRELDALTETFNAQMASVEAAEAERAAACTGAIRALAMALDARDPYTAGHSERVSVLSVAIGKVMALPDEDIEVLRLGALLHDIGKIGIPDGVLQKPGPLTPAEYDTIKEHPLIGARMLRSVPFLAPHIPIVELHHERPDGLGYPHGLRDEDIPLAARIVHVADAYDAITSARAYRRGRPSGEALRELWRQTGTMFHADIVAALSTALPGLTSEGLDRTRALELAG